MKSLQTSITEGSLFKPMLTYTVPIILSSLLQLLFNAADLVVVGRFCGSVSVGAVGATSSLTTLFVNLFVGLSVGAGVSVAHAYGANDDKKVHETVHTSIITAIFAGIVLTVLGVMFSESMLKLMDTPENVLKLSAKYMKIYFCGMTFNMLYNYSASILRAVGDTKRPLFYLTIAGVINIILNIVFVTVFHLDVVGVALATAISQAVSAVLVIISLINRHDACRLSVKDLKLHLDPLKKILGIGLPAGIQSSLFAISNVIIQSSVNSFGDVFVAGNAAAANIEGFVYVVLNSFSQTSVNFVGQNYGAKNYKRILKVLMMCLLSVTAVGLIVCTVTYYFAPSLLSIYITDSPEAISCGLTRMKYICLPYFLCGLMDVATGATRGLGSSVSPMIISIFGVVGLRIGWIFTVFNKFRTPESLFASYIISWLGTFIFQLITFVFVYNKKTKEKVCH